jgi:PAS domain S-box-containing protein
VLTQTYSFEQKPPLRTDKVVLALAAVIAVTVFAIDTFTDLDIAIAVFYVIAVLLVASTENRRAVTMTAAIVGFLTVLGFFIQHNLSDPGGAVARGLGSLVAIWSTSALSSRNLAQTATLRTQLEMLDFTHDAIVVYDLEGSITFWNHGAESLYGWTAGEAVGRRIHELTQTHFTIAQVEIDAELMNNGHWTGELRRVCRDGSLVTVASRLALWRDTKGEPRAILETSNDVTLQKDMEAELKRQQMDLRAVIDTIPGMVWSASNEGEVTFVNRRWGESGIVTTDRGAGLWSDLVHADDFGTMRSDWHVSVTSGRALDNVSRVRQRDGSYRWMHIAAEPQRDADGAVRRWYGVNTDVEARKRAEDALVRSEAFLADAQRLSRTGSIGIAANNGTMIWSAEAYRIFGYEPSQDVVPSLALIVARTHPDDRVQVEQAHRGANMPMQHIDLEYRLLMPEGTLKYVHYVAHRGPPASTDLAYVGALMDITDARQTQEALARSMAELAHVTRMTTLGEMAASIAHEVTQPMAAVVTSGDAALRWLNRVEPNLGEVMNSIGQMIKSAKRASEIVRQIRAMAQKRPVARGPIAIGDVVVDAVELMSREFQRNNVRCEVHASQDNPVVCADEVQLQQVFVNLLMNALQAMTEHGNDARRIVVTIEVLNGPEVRVGVEDNGPGIDTQTRERLFNPFFTTKANGMGMGLSICRSIVESHGGRISLEAVERTGTHFAITLPLQTEQEEVAT